MLSNFTDWETGSGYDFIEFKFVSSLSDLAGQQISTGDGAALGKLLSCRKSEDVTHVPQSLQLAKLNSNDF